tara:strand:- start:25409 stop:26965 length:1557 start_codon:yes stop_codon:yes gene_type:complete
VLRIKFVIIVSILVLFSPKGIAQLNWVNHEIEWMFNDELSLGDTVLNSNNSSINAHFVFEMLSSDTIQFGINNRWGDWLFNQNTLHVENDSYTFILRPIFNLQSGTSKYLSTRRGGFATGTIGEKFKWVSSFYENYQKFDPRIRNKVNRTNVSPGESEVKILDESYDYSVSTGGFSYEPSTFYKVTAGYGKNFIGNGYRSLLLSDAAGNYPFLRNDITIGRVKYTSIIGEFLDFTNTMSSDGLKRKKYGSFHYLDVLASKRLKLAFFEAVVWEADSAARLDLEVNYLNPFVLFRPVEFNIGSPDNMLIGLNGSWAAHSSVLLYGQVILDELHSSNLLNQPTWWGNKYGFQMGVKFHRLPIKNLVVLGEHNLVRPFTYSHKTSGKNYGHNFNSLAHPYGANFRDYVGVINYRIRRINFNSRMVYLIGGEESSSDVSNGTDIFKPYTNREFEQGYKIGYGEGYQQLFLDAKCGYILNPKYMLMLEIGYQSRTEWFKDTKENHHYLYGGIRTSLFNLYYDY